MSKQSDSDKVIAHLHKKIRVITEERDKLRRWYVNQIEILCIGLGCARVREVVDNFEERNK